MAFPSKEQSMVIGHRGDPLIVVAGPGTGKTRTLVERMIALLREDQSREVTFITFTRTSMKDTEAKLIEAFGQEVFDQTQTEFPRVSTLHTYAKRLVHRYGQIANINPAFSILMDSMGEKDLVISETLDDLTLNISIDDTSKALAQFRATHEWPEQFQASASEKSAIVERFEVLLELYRALDMEGVVLSACHILETSDASLLEIFLQVDEYQDLNPSDQEFISLLSSHPASQIAVVGDDAQSIYLFRHARLEGISDLWHSDEWVGIRFPKSFRLEPHILNAALDLIKGSNYIGAELNRKPSSGRSIVVLQCTTHPLQIEAIARDIRYRLATSEEKGNTALSLRDFLVLCPTGQQVEQVVRAFNDSYELPAQVPLKPTISENYWVLLLFLRMASTSDPLAIRQWLPLQGFSYEEITELRHRAIENEEDFFDLAISQDDKRINRLREILEQVQVSHFNSEILMSALAALELLEMPQDFPDLLERWSREDGSLPALSRLIQSIYQHLGIFDEPDHLLQDDRVFVTTLHSAKGLEANYVYCAWMSTNFMPLPGRDPDEQRRILYVALTRAKQDIILTFPERFDSDAKRRRGRVEMSPYLREIEDHLELIRINVNSVRGDSLPWHE